MQQKLKIAIIGCGSAGPASATFLARQGHEVHLFERAEKLLPIGAGFLLQPTGMHVLERLGILDKVLNDTQRINNLFCKTKQGKVLLDLHYQELNEHFFGSGTHRASFLSTLLEQSAQEGVTIHLSSPVDDISIKKDKRVVSFQEETYGEFDLVIIADGAKSELRAQLAIPTKARVYPWGALWYIGKRTKEFSSDSLWQVVDGANSLNGFLPTGTDDDLLSFFHSFEMSKVEQWKRGHLQSWKDSILECAPEAETFLEQINSHNQLATAHYHDITMNHWHADKAVILGDAAHALSPQLGQGVNLALMDAQVLALCMEQSDTLNQALSQYSQQRKKHVNFYQFATRYATPFFQSNYKLLGKLRDLGFPIAIKSKWMRRQMTASMAGTKNGIFSMMKL